MLAGLIFAAAPARALTPAATDISIPNLSIVADGGTTVVDEPADTATVTVLAVSGVAWLATGTDSTVATGQSVVYQYQFAHNGNIGIAPAQDRFYVTVTGTWVEGVFQDAACTIPATSTVDLPPNVANTFTFYVKVTAPTNAVGQSSTTTVDVKNEYYNTNGADDPYGDPDRITAAVLTSVPDNVAPVLALTAPTDGAQLTAAATLVTGTTEPGAIVNYALSPSGNTGSLTVDGAGAFSQSVALSQGSNTITVSARDASLNTTTAARTVVVDSLPPTIVITSPAAGQSLTGALAVTGTVADVNFKEYSLRYGPGLVPTAWGTITATSTLSVTSGTLGTWNTTSLYGDYTLRIAAEDTFGNVTVSTLVVSAGNSGVITGVLPVDTWTMVAIPGIPYNPDPHAWFGSGRYEVQRWDPTMSGPDPYLSQYQRNFSITAGYGFWVKPYDSALSYSVNSWVPDTTTDYTIAVKTGWNQIGNPYNRALPWDYFEFRNTGTGETRTMAQAIAAGWIDASFYSYSGGNYTAQTVGTDLAPQQGYFVKANVDGSIIIDPGAGRPEGVAKIIRPRYEWKLNIAATNGALSDTDNFAGVLRDAGDGVDPADSGEPPLVEPYLTLYFPHEEWTGAARGRYAADIRPEPTAQPAEKVWTFTVETSEPGAPVTISWPNAAALPANYDFTITDLDTGRNVDPRDTDEITITDAAAPRRFALTARKLGETPEIELAMNLNAGWNLISVPLEPEQTDAHDQLGDDMNDPMIYQYHNLEYFDPNSQDRVDIQAGIGYWVYAEQPAQVDFKGAPTSPAAPVEVPLVEGWNLIGAPYNEEETFGDNITVTYNGETLPLTQAATAGWLESRIFSFDQQTGSYQILGPGATITPFQGYIIKALKPCSIKFE